MNQVLSFAGWYFVPTAVGYLQSIYYGITIRAGDPRPRPGSSQFVKHRRRIHALVILAYLAYSVYEADWQIRRAGDFYQALGVPTDADEKAIQTRFRRLTIIHHPDKVTSPDARASADAYFVHLTMARDTLVDPAKRFAYDRFGMDMLQWRNCVTVKDYVGIGLQRLLPYYAASGMFMFILSFLGYMEYGRYWRYLSFVGMFIFELHTISRPTFPIVTRVLNRLFLATGTHPPYLPFQTLTMARKLMIGTFIAVQQAAPLLRQQDPSSLAGNKGKIQQAQLDRLEVMSKETDRAALRLLLLEKAPFVSDPQAESQVKSKLKDWLVQNTVQAEPEVRDAIGRSLQRRRAEAPVGARGTR
ncbi:hypothetical protein BDY21DRAFT_352293 [Lineolata rhizophorae]|uniref:J domain-containing protein n=1 Tax=Lineolata rhizophorae TaxID=578093 RepID=A0A6A6NT64_9PEZI|nr:hypothetical protein BDY21DRAFT_352293 [Lineolata rhizophorae]